VGRFLENAPPMNRDWHGRLSVVRPNPHESWMITRATSRQNSGLHRPIATSAVLPPDKRNKEGKISSGIAHCIMFWRRKARMLRSLSAPKFQVTTSQMSSPCKSTPYRQCMSAAPPVHVAPRTEQLRNRPQLHPGTDGKATTSATAGC
jgi:hypothetical protein